MIVFSRHTLQRMKQRKISRQEVIETIQETSEYQRDKYGHYIAQRNQNGMILRVFFDRRENKIYVITTYRTSKPKYQV